MGWCWNNNNGDSIIKHINKKYIIIALLLVYALVIVLPPIIHGYVYPNQGDDSAYHLMYFEQIQNGESGKLVYAARALTGYPLVWFSNLTGLSIDVVFLWFNYFVLVLIGVSIYVLIKRVSDWKGGLLAIPLVIFTSTAILFQFNAGAIFGLITIGIMYPLCFWLILYAVKKRKIWLWVIIGVVILAALSYHSISILSFDKEYLDPTTGVITATYSEPIPSIATFAIYILGSTSLLSLVGVAFIWFKKRPQLSIEQKVFLGLSGMITLALTIGVFSGITMFSSRLAWYLAVVSAIMIAGMVGITMKQNLHKYFGFVATILIIVSAIPQVVSWFDDNTALTKADLAAIEYVNELPGDYYSVSPNIAYWIYDRFIDGKEYCYGQYPYIDRNEPMTFKCNDLVPYYWYKVNLGKPDIKLEGSPITFKMNEITVGVYER